MARSTREEFAAKFIPCCNARRAVALRELQILRRLSPHLRLSSLRNAFQTPDSLLIILSDLCYEEMLDRLSKKTEFSESDVTIYIRQLLEGLAYIHGCDVMHLDIKPSNILMAHPTGDNIKICDFGFAQQVIPSHSQHSCFGFPEFVAPEITLNLPVSTATDLWPVGVLTYLCLHGTTPFIGENDRATLQNVLRGWSCLKRQQARLSTGSRDFICRLLAQEQKSRPSAKECLNHRWLQVSCRSSMRVTSQDRLRSFLSRTRWQCSLISHKSQMTMRPLPGLLTAPPGQQSVGVPRHLVDLTMPSSASDSDWEEATACQLPLPSLDCKGLSGSSTCRDSEGKEHVAIDSVNVQAKNQDEALMKNTPIKQAQENGSCNEEQDEKLESPSSVSAQVRRRGLMTRKRSFDLDTLNSSSDEEISGGRSAVESHRPRRRGQSCSRIEIGNSSTKASVKALPTNTNMVASRRTNSLRRRTEIKMHVQPMQWEDNRELVRSLSVESHLEKLHTRRLEIPGASTAAPENIPPDEPQRASSCTAINRTGVQFPSASSGCYGSLENSQRHRDLLNTGLVGTNVWENKNMSEDASMDIQTDVKDVSSMISQSSVMPLPPEGTSSNIIFAHSPVSSQTKKTVSSTSQTSSTALCPQKHDCIERNERTALPLQPKSPLYSGAAETIRSPDHEIAKVTTRRSSHETLLASSDARKKKATGETLELLASRAEEEEVCLIDECAKSKMAKTVQAQRNIEISASPPTSNSKEIDSQSETSLCVPDIKSTMNNTSSPTKKSPKSLSKGILRQIDVKKPTSPALTVLRKSVSVPCLGKPLEKTVSTPKNIKSFHTSIVGDNKKEQAIRNGSTLSLPNDPGRYRAQQLKFGSHKEDKVRIENIDSEEIFETMFKRKPESSLLRHLPFLKRAKSEERISARSTGTKEEGIYRPSQKGTPIEPSPYDASQGPPFDELDVLEGRVVCKSPTVSGNVETAKNGNTEASGLVHGTSSESKTALMTKKPCDAVPTCGKVVPGHADNLAVQHPLGFMRRLSSSLHKIGSKEVLNEENINVVKNEQPRRETFTKTFSQLPMASSILRRIEAKVSGLAVLRGPTHSEERLEHPFGMSSLSGDAQSTPAEKLAARTLKRATSEIILPKRPSFFQKMIHKMENKVATSPKASSSQHPPPREMEPDRLSRWERWGISRSSRKDVHKKSADTHPNLQAGPSHKEGLPPRFPVELRDENVIDSHPITLQCLPDGLPFPDICWLKDGEPLRTDNRVQLSCAPDGRYIMTVLGSTDGDAGRYQCVATNCAGRAVSTCYVTLAKLPRQLVRPAVTQLYPSGALVSWEDLETTGTVVYQLEMFEKEAECWQLVASDLAEPRLHVTELTPGSSYRFRVSYFSESIRGPLSAPSDEVTIPPRQQDSFKGISLSDQKAGEKEVDGKNQNQIAPSSAILSSKLQKPYTFLEERARGRFGVIRECRENSTGCTFAAKIVPASGRQEYEVLKSLRHPGIFGLHEAYVTPQFLVLIGESCPGKELLYHIIEKPRYTEEDLAGYLVQLLSALDYLHAQHILHLDIRSENIIISDDSHLKVIDFGSACHFLPLDLQPVSNSTSAIECAAPELLRGKPVGPQADVWAVGVLSFLLLSGEAPFVGPTGKHTEEKIKMAQVTLTHCYVNCSRLSQLFLKSLLRPSDRDRPSASGCLALPWLRQAEADCLYRSSRSFPSWKLQRHIQSAASRRLVSATKLRVTMRPTMTGH